MTSKLPCLFLGEVSLGEVRARVCVRACACACVCACVCLRVCVRACVSSVLVYSAGAEEARSSVPTFYSRILSFSFCIVRGYEEALARGLDPDDPRMSFLPASFELLTLCLTPSLPVSQSSK